MSSISDLTPMNYQSKGADSACPMSKNIVSPSPTTQRDTRKTDNLPLRKQPSNQMTRLPEPSLEDSKRSGVFLAPFRVAEVLQTPCRHDVKAHLPAISDRPQTRGFSKPYRHSRANREENRRHKDRQPAVPDSLGSSCSSDNSGRNCLPGKIAPPGAILASQPMHQM